MEGSATSLCTARLASLGLQVPGCPFCSRALQGLSRVSLSDFSAG